LGLRRSINSPPFGKEADLTSLLAHIDANMAHGRPPSPCACERVISQWSSVWVSRFIPSYALAGGARRVLVSSLFAPVAYLWYVYYLVAYSEAETGTVVVLDRERFKAEKKKARPQAVSNTGKGFSKAVTT